MSWTREDEINWTNNNPFRCHLGIKINWVNDDGGSEIALPVTPELLQAYGMVHGGIYCVLIDTVLGTCVRAYHQRDAGPITVDLNVSFLRPTGQGRLSAVGRSSRPAARSWSAAPMCSTPKAASWPLAVVLS